MIYLDNAATTKLDAEVYEAMKPFMEDLYGNPSSIYQLGRKSKKAIEEAREHVAKLIGAKKSEIYFTSGGTEADNWALKAVAYAKRNQGKHIITTKIEHPAILQTAHFLETLGYEVTYLDTNTDGEVDLEQLKDSLRLDTILISVMFANNEIGTLQPIEEIGKIARQHQILFHTDAVQAYGHLPIDVEKLSIDLLSASGHKLYGPKGIGFLYKRDTSQMGALLHGGSQEKNQRAGTQNVPGIVGLGKASEIAGQKLFKRSEYESDLRDYMLKRIWEEIPEVSLNGHRTKRLSNHLNISFAKIEGESLLMLLEQKGIFASSGSACSAGALEPSHVLQAIGLSEEAANSSLRFTLSHETKREEIDAAVEVLKESVAYLRSLRG